jgi:hypothetical protein
MFAQGDAVAHSRSAGAFLGLRPKQSQFRAIPIPSNNPEIAPSPQLP